ncbi:Uncharacterised protein [Legionella israelensis]|nr:hypothetical protein SAMN02746069_02436 [Legionella israelensis DSM 19235]STX58826.1 Uncharacterised protein [Legionella israelensis]
MSAKALNDLGSVYLNLGDLQPVKDKCTEPSIFLLKNASNSGENRYLLVL